MKKSLGWRPRASVEAQRARGRLYAAIRGFFSERGVLEVTTPVLSTAATVDPHIDSFCTRDGRWLQTSPEFAMKRLLAAGSGPIYQIAQVFRQEEAGRHHNPEFTLLEWYRPGFDHHQLMDEVEGLLRLAGVMAPSPWPRLSYRQAVLEHAGVDPLAATPGQLQAACARHVPGGVAGPAEADFCLHLLMSHAVGPKLGLEAPVFLFDFPASQAALARVRPGPPPLAERFELFWQGLELANGFHELADADEQRRRFEGDQQQRRQQNREAPPYDAHLIAALEQGLPDCAGVALGLDRLLMLMLELPSLADALAFDWDRA